VRIAVVLVLCLVACGEQVVNPELDLVRASCRRYPIRLRENGSSIYDCTFGTEFGPALSCLSGNNLSRSWRYASLEDFVREVSVPNRFRRTSSLSTGAFGRTGTTIEYQYDDQGRYALRVRSALASTPRLRTIDTTSFLTWDGRGRPLSGRIVRPTGEEELVTIAYDDTLRDVVWSNGERHRMDRHGNTLLETWVFATDASPREFEILATAETCLD
jgi:hypothetical protein